MAEPEPAPTPLHSTPPQQRRPEQQWQLAAVPSLASLGQAAVSQVRAQSQVQTLAQARTRKPCAPTVLLGQGAASPPDSDDDDDDTQDFFIGTPAVTACNSLVTSAAPGSGAHAQEIVGSCGRNESSCENFWEKSEAARDSIKVCVRVRPLSAEELAARQPETVLCYAQCTESLQLAPPTRDTASTCAGATNAVTTHSFDAVLASSTPQRQVYSLIGEQVVQGVTGGYHGCVFAYGQTGSGKTHTMFGGTGEERGLVPRIAEGLFSSLEQSGEDYAVKLSYFELYNEKVRDLLTPATQGSPASLEVREHPRVGVFVQGLTKNLVRSAAEVTRLLDFGHKIRVVGSTNMNAVSSRSHAVVTLHVERVVAAANATGEEAPLHSKRRRAQLHAVDLAGSERLSHAGESEVRQRESKQINKSLLALSQMISRLVEREHAGAAGRSLPLTTAHIPYRDSKLTFLLGESLMGNCKTAMLACVSPAAQCFSMAESTIRFAESVKRIRTRPVRNEEVEGDLVKSLQNEIEILRRRMEDDPGAADAKQDLREQLQATQGLQEELSRTWAEEQALTARADRDRHRVLASLGLAQPPAHEGAAPLPTKSFEASAIALAGEKLWEISVNEVCLQGEERARRLARNEDTLKQLTEGAQRLLLQAKTDAIERKDGGNSKENLGHRKVGRRAGGGSPIRSVPPIW